MGIFIKDMLNVLCTNLLKNALKNKKKVIANVHVILGHPSYLIWLRKLICSILQKKYNLSEIKYSIQEIKNLLIRYFVNEDIFGEDSLSHIVETHPEIRLKELELEHKFELEKMQLEKRKRRKRKGRKAVGKRKGTAV
jgi:hypothetical protein